MHYRIPKSFRIITLHTHTHSHLEESDLFGRGRRSSVGSEVLAVGAAKFEMVGEQVGETKRAGNGDAVAGITLYYIALYLCGIIHTLSRCF